MAVSKRIRTDLALETTERFKEENTEIRGVEIQEDYETVQRRWEDRRELTLQ